MNNKEGAIIVVAGWQGSGKSPWTKSKIARFTNKVIYDRRMEYDTKKYTIFYNLQAFRKFITLIENTAIVAEEATGYVKLYKEDELTDIIIGIQHNRNVFFLLFHSLMDIPKSILRNGVDFVIVFPTSDTLQEIERNRPRLLPAFVSEKRTVKGSDGKMWNVPVIFDYKNQKIVKDIF